MTTLSSHVYFALDGIHGKKDTGLQRSDDV